MSLQHCCRPYTASTKRTQDPQYGFDQHTCEDAGRRVVAVAHIPLVAVPDVVNLQRGAVNSQLFAWMQLSVPAKYEGRGHAVATNRQAFHALIRISGSEQKCDPPIASCSPNLELWLVLECLQGQGRGVLTAQSEGDSIAHHVRVRVQGGTAKPGHAGRALRGAAAPKRLRSRRTLQLPRSGQTSTTPLDEAAGTSTRTATCCARQGPNEPMRRLAHLLLNKPFLPYEARTRCQVWSLHSLSQLHSHSPCEKHPGSKKHTLWYIAPQKKLLTHCSWGQDHVRCVAATENVGREHSFGRRSESPWG